MKARDLESLDEIFERAKKYTPTAKPFYLKGDNAVSRYFKHKESIQRTKAESEFKSPQSESDRIAIEHIFNNSSIADLKANIFENPERAKGLAITLLMLEDLNRPALIDDKNVKQLCEQIKIRYKDSFDKLSEEKPSAHARNRVKS